MDTGLAIPNVLIIGVGIGREITESTVKHERSYHIPGRNRNRRDHIIAGYAGSTGNRLDEEGRMKNAIAIVIIILAVAMIISFCFAPNENDSDQKEQTTESEQELEFHPVFVPTPKGGIQMTPIWY